MGTMPPTQCASPSEPATLRDVAAVAGVSRSTASRALAGSSAIRAETKEQVLKAAASLGYRPNVLARGLRTKRSRIVGLVLHNLLNTSFHTIVRVQQEHFESLGYTVMLCITGDDPEREARALEMLREQQVAGVMIVGTGQNQALLRDFERERIPVVSMVRRIEGAGTDTVLASDQEGSYLATRHLLDLGHREIGLIVGRQGTTSGDERLAGYLRAMAEAGAPAEGLVRQGDYDPEFGVTAVEELLGSRPAMTALFAANHEASFGALPALFARGISVPEELSVICYEDIPWFSWWKPPITTVDNSPAEIGELGAEMLHRKMVRAQESGDAFEPGYGREFRAASRLVLRQSVAAPRS